MVDKTDVRFKDLIEQLVYCFDICEDDEIYDTVSSRVFCVAKALGLPIDKIQEDENAR